MESRESVGDLMVNSLLTLFVLSADSCLFSSVLDRAVLHSYLKFFIGDCWVDGLLFIDF